MLKAGGIVAGYVDYMGEADRELALRQGPPALVEIQDFRPGFDAGPADEVRLVAEFDLDSAVTVPVRGSDPARWQLLVPIFPVSDLGAALVAPKTRRFGALAAIALFLGVFPGNANMVRLWCKDPAKSLPLRFIAIARLPMQVPMITQALKVYRES